MTSEQTLAFIGFALVMAGTPGPSNSLLTATAAQVGIVRGLPALLGVAVGMAALMFSVTMGLGALILATPMIVLLLRIIGAAILAWLAFQIATSSLSVHTDASSDSAPPRPVGFATAAAFQWVNPKSWLAAASAAAFLTPSTLSAPVHAGVLAAIFVAVAIPSCFAWLAFGAALHRILRSPDAQRTFNHTMAALLAVSALTLLLT